MLNKQNIKNLLIIKKEISTATDIMDLFMMYGASFACANGKDIVITTTPAVKKTAAKKAAVKKKTAAKKAAKKTTITKSVVAKIKKEVKKAILALSFAKARATQRLLGRSLGAERYQGYKGVQLLEKLAQEVTLEGVQWKHVAIWEEARAYCHLLFKAVAKAGLN